MRVVWARAALADLDEIADHIKADNPDRAVSFAREIFDAGEAIGDLPRAFPLIPELEHKAVRRRPFGSYLILYRVGGETVEILHVIHGARDYIRALFPDVI